MCSLPEIIVPCFLLVSSLLPLSFFLSSYSDTIYLIQHFLCLLHASDELYSDHMLLSETGECIQA